MSIETLEFIPGHIVITDDAGQRVRQPIGDILRALDIPAGLTYNQVGAITTLANLIVVLIRTLIDRDVLDDSFLEDGDYNLESIAEAIEEMGGDYRVPDLSVS